MLSNLLGVMKTSKVSQSDLAKLLGLSNNAISHKMRGRVDFTSSEMYAIRDRYFPDKTLDWLFKPLED